MCLEILITESSILVHVKSWLAYFYQVIFTFLSPVAHKTGKWTFDTSQELSER